MKNAVLAHMLALLELDVAHLTRLAVVAHRAKLVLQLGVFLVSIFGKLEFLFAVRHKLHRLDIVYHHQQQ